MRVMVVKRAGAAQPMEQADGQDEGPGAADDAASAVSGDVVQCPACGCQFVPGTAGSAGDDAEGE